MLRRHFNQIGDPDGSLKEKLSDHYARRDFKVREDRQASITGIAFALGMMITLAIEGVLILIPAYYLNSNGQPSSWFFVAEFIVVWLFVESAINWWLTYFDVANRVTKEMKTQYCPGELDTPPGWRYCMTCQLDAPPRSHHCTLCNFCILKRDQHCFFTGSCVGYHNQRTFIIYCLYVVLASGSAAFMQISYLNAQIPLFTDAAVFYIPGVGIWQFLTGSTHIINVFILLHLYFTIFSLGLGLWFLGWQLLIVSRGQTSYEAWKNINVYRHASVFSNFYDVFGSPLNALMCLAVPVRGSSPADGIKWNIRAKSEKGH